MALSPRFALDGAVMTAGAFLAVASMSFGSAAAGWVSFGVSAGVTVAAGVGTLAGRRGLPAPARR